MSEAGIKAVVEKGYIQAAFVERDADAMSDAFHSEFVMFFREGDTPHSSLKQFQDFIRAYKERTPVLTTEYTWEIDVLDITETAAVVKTIIFGDKKRLYTDYLCLYYIDGRWQIVTKTFVSH